MPLRRLKIVATQQCLQLQPSGSGSRSSRTTPCLDVRYESSKISSSSTLFAENAAANVSIDAYGIVGISTSRSLVRALSADNGIQEFLH